MTIPALKTYCNRCCRTIPLVIAIIALFIVSEREMYGAEIPDYVTQVRPILQKHCYACHGEEKQSSGFRLDIRAEAFKGGELYGESIFPGKPAESPLIQFVAHDDADLIMPPEGEGEKLSPREKKVLIDWVQAGAAWPAGVDLAKLVDRRDHWSFKPLRDPELPHTKNTRWAKNEIDTFILARLEQAGLQPAEAADRLSLLRRVCFDLTGLPPSSEQLSRYLAEPDAEAAYAQLVEELLASPHYGERFAQHWLDVVRYADTHGFEVNTERPHAWPYRDYVIQAFNDDRPYDQFIREQLAGDAYEQNAATGFLITASVLLPGQIGKDEPSKRLARQDSLDEIVTNISQTFLGLTVGCARCHDHKFDAISQKDYFEMQAFVAGVQYQDRPLRLMNDKSNQQEAKRLRQRLAVIQQQLEYYAPLAQIEQSQRKGSQPELNVEKFPAQAARYVRMTIVDSNLHPQLGLIEPVLDELEVYASEHSPDNLAVSTTGTEVTVSGSRLSLKHRPEHLNDGEYGNSKSWMSDTPGRGWVLLKLPQAVPIDKVIWSRDRLGKFQDRLATGYKIEVGLTPEDLTPVVDVPPLRPAVNPRKNIDRFLPVTTKKLRFQVTATNGLAACLDELEVWNVERKNVALASEGTQISCSGKVSTTGKHQLAFAIDGQYGNDSSWISSEADRGWIELEFATPQKIERVIWSRDREGKFADRLATEYVIEVANSGEEWQMVATSADRTPFIDNSSSSEIFPLAGLPEQDRPTVQLLYTEQQELQQKLTRLQEVQKVFAGTFSTPDKIHLLRRGNPEQPVEEVLPAVLDALGTLELTPETPEQERRKQLAEWIVQPDHPLTARVMVNRIWLSHFGAGLVTTPNDFGRNGVAPTHPQLLDWLSKEFVRSGWSVKHLHRLIVHSSTYRQAANWNEQAAAVDAANQLLWRYPTRRLEGEAIRDSILFVSGQLNEESGGPGYNLFDKRGGLSGFQPIEQFSSDGLRRMIYAHKVRRERDAVFGAFDCPDGGQSAPQRSHSTTPIQALNLFNSRFVLDQAEAYAQRVKSQAGADPQAQIQLAYQWALCREPAAEEIAAAEPVVTAHGLAMLCRALFNSNEFLFIP